MKSLSEAVGRARALGAGLVLVLTTAMAAHAQVNAVYVESNISTTNNNTIIGFSNDGSGNLTPLPGSPYKTGGTGWGGSLGIQQDDDQQVVTNAAGTLLFAVNGHSNTIASFTINADGSLTPNGSPIQSAGTQPASLGLFDNVLPNGASLLVVANKSSDPSQTNSKIPNLSTFTVSATGTMTANVGLKVNLASGDSPSQAAVGQAKLLFVDEFMHSPSQLSSYRIHANGLLTLNSSIPVPTGLNVFLGLAVHPTASVLYAALPADNQIGVYTYVNGTGVLSFVTTVPTTGSLACWLGISPDGSRLYSAETGSGTITVYDTSVPTAPVQLQHYTMSTVGDAHPAPWEVKFDPTGKFLYAVSNQYLHVINVAADGTLSETVSPVNLNVPAGTFPYGLATALR